MKIKFSTCFALTAMMFASCSDQHDPLPGDTTNEIKFVSGLNDPTSRITTDGSQWLAGDQIGIYMVESGSTTPSATSNVRYTAESSASVTVFSPAETAITYPKDESPVDFMAYYPYSASVDYAIYPIRLSDQSAGLAAHDLMYAKADNGGKGFTSGSVSFEFAHQLSKIALYIFDENDNPVTATVNTMTIKGMTTTANFYLNTGVLTEQANKADIIPYKNENSYDAVLLPFTFGTGHEVAITIADKSYTWIMKNSYSGLQMKGGYSYTFHIKINTTTGETTAELIDFNGNSIAPWGNTGGEEEEYDTNLGLPAHENDGLVRAFPGAEGGGMFTTGGRGGRVIKVTNLNDAGPGSLRAAISESGARTIIFDVDGIIELQSTLKISNGDITIAGQTAPGDGICLKNYALVVAADNVIIRYIRCRMGDDKDNEDDAMWGRWQKNIIIDHCSMSWSTDECSSFYANENFTMQWCILSESLRNSAHAKGAHGYGAIWGGVNASYHHNLLAHHESRNPRFDGADVYKPHKSDARYNDADRSVDYRNCVVYNFGNYPAYGGENQKINFVGNYYKWGPGSIGGASTSDTKGKQRKYFYNISDSKEGVMYGSPSIFTGGNTNILYTDQLYAEVNNNNWNGFNVAGNVTDFTRLTSGVAINPDGKAAKVTNHTAEAAFEQVLTYAGANLKRDAVDDRAVYDTKNGVATYMTASNGSKNGYVDRPSDVGGWPTYNQGTPKTDTDGDGIPDSWEDAFGLDRNSAADANEKTLDPSGRYTNLEIYLHYLVKDIVNGQVEGGTYTQL